MTETESKKTVAVIGPGDVVTDAEDPKLLDLGVPKISYEYIHLEGLTPSDDLLGDPNPTLIASLGDFGMMNPIWAIQGNGVYRILDGARRVKAARILAKKLSATEMKDRRLDPVCCAVFPEGTSDAEAFTIIANHHREANERRDYDAFRRIADRHGASADDLAKELMLPVRRVRQIMRLRNLPEPLQQGFLDGKIKPGIAQRIAKWPEDRQKQAVDVLKTQGKVTGPDLETLSSVMQTEAVAAIPLQVWETPGMDEVAEAATPAAEGVAGDVSITATAVEQLKALVKEMLGTAKTKVTKELLQSWAQRIEEALP